MQAAPTSTLRTVPLTIVCLGASAGGLRALEAFFRAIPPDSGCCFVVVQHLSPDFKSLMDDLLSRQTSMPIVQAEDGMHLTPDRVHLLPPRKLMALKHGAFVLSDRENDRLGQLPIDLFLRSLALEAGPRAICAILSGTGSDGSEGAKEVHAAGGLVLVQEPDSAEFDGMPRSALALGIADYVLPPERMPEVITAYVRDPTARLPIGRAEPAENSNGDEDPEFTPIFVLLREAFGLNFAHYKLATVGRRIDRRMTMIGAESVAAYIDQLSLRPAELDALYHDLLIGVTEFFRDPFTFTTLAQQIYRPLMTGKRREEIRVWVAGCATGEEAYTQAILLDELARETGYTGRISIFATDVHRASVETAALGVYPRALLANLSPERLARYFKEEKNGSFRILPEIRQRIVFAPHNLLGDPPFTRLDAVSCRNLLIYLTPEAQERVIGLFHYALLRDGALLLGLSESLGRLENDFAVVDTKAKLFRKTRESRVPMELRQGTRLPGPRSSILAATTHAGVATILPKGLLDAYDQILAEYVPDGFVVNEEADILHFIGNGARYLAAQAGRASHNLIHRTEGDLRLSLSTLLPKAARSRLPALAQGVRTGEIEGSEQLIDVTVRPLVDERGGVLFHVVLGARRPAPSLSQEPTAGTDEAFALSGAQTTRINDLEVELQHTKRNLQSTVEELQTTNEELQASNEEMLAANEELQSTNEELHSVNEELYTVNAEFERKNAELKLLNADLDNLFNATRDGTLILDRDMRIRKFNPAIESFFKLLPQDIGRPLAHIAYHLDDHASMLAELDQVLTSGEVIENEVRTRQGRWLLKRVHPFYAGHRTIDGVILTFTDIEHLKKMQDKLDLAMASSRLVWWEWDVTEDRLNTHASSWCILGYAMDSLTPCSGTWFQLTHPDDLPRVRALLDACLQGRSSTWECEHRLKERSGGWRWVLNKGSVTARDAAGRPLRMLGTTQDVHERHTAQTEVIKLHHAIEQTAVSVVITDSSGAIEYVNPFFTRITGYTEAEVIGQNPRLLRSELTSPSVHVDLWATITRGEIWRGELTNRRKDGTHYVERVTIAPVKDSNGHITHFIAVKEDITALRAENERRARLEQQLARTHKMETLGTLAGGIAHDFNNLLTSILGYAEVTKLNLPAELPPEHLARSGLDRIQQAGRRASDLVRRILAFSRHHAVSLQSVRLDRVVGESLAILKASLPATLELTLQDSSEAAAVLGDATQLQQVLINLCTNAAHAIGDRTGRIVVALERADIKIPFTVEAGTLVPGPYVLLRVSDTGPGMTKEIVDRVFEPFFTTKEAGQGTGLGLPIVLSTVLGHKGAIGIKTAPGQGSSFTVYLPRELAPTPEEEPPAVEPLPLQGGGQRIAIVDDDESIAQLNRVALEQSGYQGTIFADAASCLAKLRADPHAFALVLTDQTMPGMTGIELIRALRATPNPVPAIITSGYSRLLDTTEIERLGQCLFVPKPFPLKGLLGHVRDLLAKHPPTPV